MSGRRIDIDDRELDAAADTLRGITSALKLLEPRLARSLADGIPGELGAKVVEVVVRNRIRADEVGDSATRQAGELNNRAIFARLADDRGTKDDVKALVAMSTGPNSIDLDKRESYRFLLETLALLITTGKTATGADRTNPLGVALTKWEKWWGKQQQAYALGEPRPQTTHKQLTDQVFGKPVWVMETGPAVGPDGTPILAAAIAGEVGASGERATPPSETPKTNRPGPLRVTSGEVTTGGDPRGAGNGEGSGSGAGGKGRSRGAAS